MEEQCITVTIRVAHMQEKLTTGAIKDAVGNHLGVFFPGEIEVAEVQFADVELVLIPDPERLQIAA